MGGVPTFQTDRLVLRPPSLTDVPACQRHFVDYEVIRHLSAANVSWPFPENGVRDFLTNAVLPSLGRDRWFWAIFEKAQPAEMIGAVDIWRDGHPDHRGFWLGRRFWGRGYMSEALAPIMDYAFDALGFDVMILSNAKGNLRSRRIKEKVGARYLRTVPRHQVDPSYRELELWELTREEWREHRTAG